MCLPLQIVMPPHLEKVRDKLAENIHELWGMNKIELGWSYGKVRHMQIRILTADREIRSIIHTFCHVCGEINLTMEHFETFEIKIQLEMLAVSSD